MIPHDILTLYTAKMIEYGIAVMFLLLFVPFWRFVQAPARALQPVRATAAARKTTLADWFSVPEDLLFHRGHAWARPEASGTVAIGLNDFAAHLVGPVSRIALPSVGTRIGQGEQAWRIVGDDGRAVEMLAPVDGAVVEVNAALAEHPELALTDPFGRGWLMKVQPNRLRANLTGLLSGQPARRWMQDVAAGLQTRIAPGMGALAQDGGAPMPGIARMLDAEHWNDVASEFLLTAEETRHA
jgi:glycine cleavage system H lipoate-binding protein